VAHLQVCINALVDGSDDFLAILDHQQGCIKLGQANAYGRAQVVSGFILDWI